MIVAAIGRVPILLCLALVGLAGMGCTCAQPEREPSNPPAAAAPATSGAPPLTPLVLRQVFPHIRLDARAGVVEFDARVTPLMHFPETPVMWLEVIVTTPDAKPHETLLVTDARPSHVHAALLLAGLEPGRPGGVFVDDQGTTVRFAPSGPPLRVRFGVPRTSGDGLDWVDPREWVVDHDSGRRLTGAGWVFAGSLVEDAAGGEVYAADLNGTLIGLVTFGTETIAWTEPVSDQATVDAPVWIADIDRVPPNETPVVVRVERSEPATTTNHAK